MNRNHVRAYVAVLGLDDREPDGPSLGLPLCRGETKAGLTYSNYMRAQYALRRRRLTKAGGITQPP